MTIMYVKLGNYVKWFRWLKSRDLQENSWVGVGKSGSNTSAAANVNWIGTWPPQIDFWTSAEEEASIILNAVASKVKLMSKKSESVEKKAFLMQWQLPRRRNNDCIHVQRKLVFDCRVTVVPRRDESFINREQTQLERNASTSEWLITKQTPILCH